jgi:Flp pilus assembly protein TadG
VATDSSAHAAREPVNLRLTRHPAARTFRATIQQSVSAISGGIDARSREPSGLPMPSSAVSLKNLLRRFSRHRRGSAAVEFALVAPVFFALLFAIVEVATMFFASQVLETVTQTSARYIMTGQAQSGALTQSQFKSYVCTQIPALFTCANVQIDVESAPSFGSISNNNPYDANGNFSGPTSYCPGNAGDIVFVRLSYQWPLFVTGLGFNMSNPGSNKKWLTSTAAFQNEPFSAPSSAC